MKNPKPAPHQHVPAVIHRTGGPPAEVLNRCATCGKQIVPIHDPVDKAMVGWLTVTDVMADDIRRQYR